MHLKRIDNANHRTTGAWSAAQNFYHLASAFEGSMDRLPHGYPFVVRLIVRPIRWIVTGHRFPPWLPIPSAIRHKLEPPRDLEFVAQKERLLRMIDAFRDFSADHPPHPVLGRLSRDEWIGFHLRHCEHHLSFVQID
jgi:hypothetical protein